MWLWQKRGNWNDERQSESQSLKWINKLKQNEKFALLSMPFTFFCPRHSPSPPEMNCLVRPRWRFVECLWKMNLTFNVPPSLFCACFSSSHVVAIIYRLGRGCKTTKGQKKKARAAKQNVEINIFSKKYIEPRGRRKEERIPLAKAEKRVEIMREFHTVSRKRRRTTKLKEKKRFFPFRRTVRMKKIGYIFRIFYSQLLKPLLMIVELAEEMEFNECRRWDVKFCIKFLCFLFLDFLCKFDRKINFQNFFYDFFSIFNKLQLSSANNITL